MLKRIQYFLIMLFVCLTCQSSNSQHQLVFMVNLYQSESSKEYYTNIKIDNAGRCAILDSVTIDTGCTGIYLNSSDYDNFLKQGIITEKDFIGYVNNNGITNKMLLNKRYSIKSLQIGNALLQDVIVTFGTNPESKGNKMRLIGMQVLSRFDSMSIDFNKDVMYLYKY